MNELKKTSRRKSGLEVVRALVAGVDIGSEEHWIAGPPLEDGSENVRRFGTTSEQLAALVEWVEAQKLASVAMESTGVYWIPLYELFEQRGIEVMLVNARDFHHAPGRPKTDRLDCQWLQRLHSCAMLRGSFRPNEVFIPLRTLHRQRANLLNLRTRFIQWMQKSFDQMNVQVHHAVSDLSGVTGMAIVRAIVAGERSPEALAALRDPRCKKTGAEIAKYLTGTWRDEHLFTLASALRQYDANEQEITKYEEEIAKQLDALQLNELKEVEEPKHPKATKERQLRQKGEVTLRNQLWRATGKDLTRIDGIGVNAAQLILAEVGLNLDAFPDERHFISWLRLCPPTKISGGKPLKARRNGLSANRIAGALRMAARGVDRTKTAIGAYFRSVSRTKGYSVAIFATARKLAQYVYRLLRYGTEYLDIGEKEAEAKYLAGRLTALERAAKAQGFALTPIAQLASTV
jgi:transposase